MEIITGTTTFTTTHHRPPRNNNAYRLIPIHQGRIFDFRHITRSMRLIQGISKAKKAEGTCRYPKYTYKCLHVLTTRHLHVIHTPIPRIISTQASQVATDLYNLASSEHRQQATNEPKGTPARRRGAEEYTSTTDHFPRRLISTEDSCSNKYVDNRHTLVLVISTYKHHIHHL